MEALHGLVKSVPDWHGILDDLNKQIANRQRELAQADIDYRPPTRSLKNKGSTESLKPKNNDTPMGGVDDLFVAEKVDEAGLPVLTRDTVFATPNLAKEHGTAAVPPSRLVHHSSSPGPTNPIRRQLSQRIASQHESPTMGSPVIRKRKTQSMVSNGSQTPKYRTRSMIIVYYDSTVQHAFEELVKHISSSRNAMRKGKMAERMACMRQMAEMEVGDDDDDDDDTQIPSLSPYVPKSTPRAENGVATFGTIIIADDGPENEKRTEKENGYVAPKLQYLSTRRMGPTRDSPLAAQEFANRPMLGFGRAGARMGLSMPRSTNSSIYDSLDAGLEWCQSMCEHAAHQFLRDGECNEEIEGIKKRLGEVRDMAQGEVNKSAAPSVEAKPKEVPAPSITKVDELPRSLKSPQMRKSVGSPEKDRNAGASQPQILVADEMEVDDDEFLDEEEPLKWIAARSRIPRAGMS